MSRYLHHHQDWGHPGAELCAAHLHTHQGCPDDREVPSAHRWVGADNVFAPPKILKMYLRAAALCAPPPSWDGPLYQVPTDAPALGQARIQQPHGGQVAPGFLPPLLPPHQVTSCHLILC